MRGEGEITNRKNQVAPDDMGNRSDAVYSLDGEKVGGGGAPTGPQLEPQHTEIVGFSLPWKVE